MNRNLSKAIFSIKMADALMFSIEQVYLDIEVDPKDRERADRGAYMFYALWDAIRKASEDLDTLSGDLRVVDAIYAARDVRRSSTLKTED